MYSVYGKILFLSSFLKSYLKVAIFLTGESWKVKISVKNIQGPFYFVEFYTNPVLILYILSVVNG